jgi:hypothetical protein
MALCVLSPINALVSGGHEGKARSNSRVEKAHTQLLREVKYKLSKQASYSSVLCGVYYQQRLKFGADRPASRRRRRRTARPNASSDGGKPCAFCFPGDRFR